MELCVREPIAITTMVRNKTCDEFERFFNLLISVLERPFFSLRLADTPAHYIYIYIYTPATATPEVSQVDCPWIFCRTADILEEAAAKNGADCRAASPSRQASRAASRPTYILYRSHEEATAFFSCPTTFRLTVDHTAQHPPTAPTPTSPKTHRFVTRNRSVWLKIRLLFPA